MAPIGEPPRSRRLSRTMRTISCGRSRSLNSSASRATALSTEASVDGSRAGGTTEVMGGPSRRGQGVRSVPDRGANTMADGTGGTPGTKVQRRVSGGASSPEQRVERDAVGGLAADLFQPVDRQQLRD